MTKSLKESQSFDIVSGKEFGQGNRRPLAGHVPRGQRLHALDMAIAKLRVHEHETMQRGAINNGLKYREIFKRGREMLMQIREG